MPIDTGSARKITKLEVQKNNAHRANVYLDGEFALGVHQDLILEFGLHKGCTLSVEDQQKLEAADAVMKAKDVALEYLAHKQRTEQELRTRLASESYLQSVIEAVVDRIDELGYLDDEQYAHDYVRGRFSNRRFGPFRIRQELRERGVDERFIDQALEELSQEAVRDAARYHAQKKWKQMPDSESYLKRKRKAKGYLRRRGFGFQLIRSVLDEVTDESR